MTRVSISSIREGFYAHEREATSRYYCDEPSEGNIVTCTAKITTAWSPAILCISIGTRTSMTMHPFFALMTWRAIRAYRKLESRKSCDFYSFAKGDVLLPESAIRIPITPYEGWFGRPPFR